MIYQKIDEICNHAQIVQMVMLLKINMEIGTVTLATGVLLKEIQLAIQLATQKITKLDIFHQGNGALYLPSFA